MVRQAHHVPSNRVSSCSIMENYDAIIVGAGAAGLFCAYQAAKRGARVLVLEAQEKPGKKILISGGGRCNFTNLYAGPENYISANPHFCKSALSRFSPGDFVEFIKAANIPFHEKKDGQLFCDRSSKDILNLLLQSCQTAGVIIKTSCQIKDILKNDALFCVISNLEKFLSSSIIIATGALSFANLGATDFGYTFAKRNEIRVINPKPGLVPLRGSPSFIKQYAALSGVSFVAQVSIGKRSFTEALLITHEGLSGPAILQISSYWNAGDKITINIGPNLHLLVREWHKESDLQIHNFLSRHLPRRFVEAWLSDQKIPLESPKKLDSGSFKLLLERLQNWEFVPQDTLGYAKAEVTVGGVDTEELSSKTMESKKVKGLYFIGEVVDVTGWLGGYNFQWAWASAHAAAGTLSSSGNNGA